LVQQATKRLTHTETGSPDGTTGGRGESDSDEDEEQIATQEDAERYLAKLEKLNRYKQETWS